MAVLALVFLAVLACGVWFYRTQERHLRQEVENDLFAIAELKASQIVQWRADRLADGAILMHSPFLIEGVERFLASQPAPSHQQAGTKTEDADAILSRFRALHEHYRYSDVLLVAPDGEVRLSLSGVRGAVGGETLSALTAAMRDRKPLLTDLHIDKIEPLPHINVVAPLLVRGQTQGPIGAVILLSDARQFLYPLIQSWPTASETAETLIVRRDGEDVLFLNELRHQPDAGLALRIPLSRTDVPAVMAALGREGVVQGRDYRGAEALAVLKAIPDSPWFMVAKKDKAEAFAVWRFRSVLILGLLLGLVAFVGAASFVVYQRNQKAHYRVLYQSEAALRASEEEHRVTLMSAGDAVIATDSEGRVKQLNPVAESLTGWTQDEARGKPIEEVFRIVNEETRRMVKNPVERVLCEGVVVGLANHTLLIARDGTERPIADSGAPIRDEQGTITGVVLVFHDQTEERAAQRALKESEERYRTLVEEGFDGIFIQKGSKITFANRPLSEMLGYNRGELEGKDHWLVYHPDYQKFTRERANARMRGEAVPSQYQVKLQRKDGSSFDGEVLARRIMFGDDPGIQVWVRDITERKCAEEERRKSEEFQRAIVACSPVALYSLDQDGNVITWNASAERMFGWTTEEIVGKPLGVVPEDKQEEFREIRRRVMLGQTFLNLETIRRKKDGTRLDVSLSTAPIIDAEGNVIDIMSHVVDITERKRAEQEMAALQEQLRQSQKMEAIGQLAGGIAHDFNNLLTIISGSAQLSLLDLQEGDPLKANLEEIRRASDRAADLTRQLLAFSRKQILEMKVLDMNQVLERLDKMLRRVIGEDIALEVIPAEPLGKVKADPGQMEQVWMNLVVNARDAMPEGGKLTIETANVELDEEYARRHIAVKPGSYVMLSVSDTGMGMTPEVKERLFEPFFTTKEMGKGTGLGLSTVYGIVKQSGGNIWVYSEPGQGTTFKIYLPQVDEPLEELREEEIREIPHGSETVLVVEDEETVRKLAVRILKRQGYKVLEAEDGGKAFMLCEKFKEAIHLILTDVVMPGMSGRKLAERLKEIHPEAKVLYMSGYTDNAILHHGVLEPGIQFLQKPFTVEGLSRKVREALDK